MSHTDQKETPTNGRDSNGRFVKGNSGGPGNPFARQMARFRTELMASVTDEDVQDIAKRFVDMAKGGSVPAAKFLFSYIIGKPTAPAVEPDKLDVHEWDVFRETAEMQSEYPRIGEAPHPELALRLLRFTRPKFAEICREDLLDVCKEQQRQDQQKAARKERRKRKQKRKGSAIRNGVAPRASYHDVSKQVLPSTNGFCHPGHR